MVCKAQEREGATFLKYSIGCMQQPGAKREMRGHRFQMRGPDTTGHPAGDGSAKYIAISLRNWR